MPSNELIQLPNKDLWRGSKRIPPLELKEVIVAEEQDPMNKAMAAVIASAKGAQTLPCLWCGQGGHEQWMREHLKTNHKSVLERSNDAQIAIHDMTQAQLALAEADKKE